MVNELACANGVIPGRLLLLMFFMYCLTLSFTIIKFYYHYKTCQYLFFLRIALFDRPQTLPF